MADIQRTLQRANNASGQGRGKDKTKRKSRGNGLRGEVYRGGKGKASAGYLEGNHKEWKNPGPMRHADIITGNNNGKY